MSISFALVRGVDAWLGRSIRHQDTVQLIVLVLKEFGLSRRCVSVFEAPAMAGAAALTAQMPRLSRNRPMRMRRRAPSGCPAAGDYQWPSLRHPYEVAIDDARW